MLTPEQRAEFLQTLHEPHYVNPEHKGPILMYGFWGGQKIEFWASPYDSMEYGREVYQKAVNGEYGEVIDGPYEEEKVVTEFISPMSARITPQQ